MIDRGETLFFQHGQRASAASSSLAMNEDRLGFFQNAESSGEILREDVCIVGVSEMTFTKLFRRADIQDGDSACLDQFGRRFSIDVFNFVFSHGWQCEGDDEAEDKGEATHDCLVILEHFNEGFLRDIHSANGFHALFTFLLFVEQLALA